MTVYDIIKELGVTKCWCTVYGEVYVICTKDIRYIDLLLKENGNVVMRLDEDGKLDDKGECLIFPSKDNRYWSKVLNEAKNELLPPFTPVMVSDNGENWSLRCYMNGQFCSINRNSIYGSCYRYIVPVSKFDFEADDPFINIKNSINQ